MGRQHLIESVDYGGENEQPPALGKQADEAHGEVVGVGLGEDRRHGAHLFIARQHRAAHQPLQGVAVAQQSLERIEIARDLVESPRFDRQLEQRRRIAPRESAHSTTIFRHSGSTPCYPPRGGKRLIMKPFLKTNRAIPGPDKKPAIGNTGPRAMQPELIANLVANLVANTVQTQASQGQRNP